MADTIVQPFNEGPSSSAGQISTQDGAYIKFTITLEKQSLCSQISFKLFAKYPMEIISLKYEEDVETYHEPKELVQNATQRSSSTQIKIMFPNVLAKRFTVVFNQPNYEKNTYLVRKDWTTEQSLWNEVLAREVDITLNSADGLETVEQSYLDSLTGWNAYLASLDKYNAELKVWQGKMDSYNKEYDAYKQRWGISALSIAPFNVVKSLAYSASNPAPGYSADDYRTPLYNTKVTGMAPKQESAYVPKYQGDIIQQAGKQWQWDDRGWYTQYKPPAPSYNYPSYDYSPPSYTYTPPRPAPPVSPGPAPTFTFETQKEEIKYEYVQGIRNISISGEEYAPKSIYVTKPIEVPGNIVEASLSSEETHPLMDEVSGESTARQTSVEYYIAYEENPSVDDWHAILPEEQKEVLCELLMFRMNSAADLRFPAVATKDGNQQGRVYKDATLLDKSKWSFANGGRQIQLLETYSPSSIYTIDYTPNTDIKNPWVLNVVQENLKKIRQVDRFPQGTNRNKTITLSKYPYVNYELINQTFAYEPNTSPYKPLSVRILSANIAGQNRTTYTEVQPYNGIDTQPVFTKNVTDYKTAAWKPLTPYSIKADDLYKGFDYFHEQNKLYFSETFNKADIQTNIETNHGNGTIEVSYEYLVSSFRIKIILRRNGPGVNSITPIVHSYALKLKSMN